MTDRYNLCPQCEQGHLIYRCSHSYGHPDDESFQAYDIYECDRCGALDEKDVS